MKARVISSFVFVAGLALLLAVASAAQGMGVKAASRSSASVLPASSTSDFAQAVQNSARLGHASTITFTPAFTIYLPLVAKNFFVCNCSPGQIIFDPVMDVSIAHIDVTALNSALGGETLQATFHIRDVPSQLTFDRVGVPQYYAEYYWDVYVDVDNDPQTGCDILEGAEYWLGAMHIVLQPDSPVTQPIGDGVQADVFEYNPADGYWHYLASANLDVDAQSDTMTLTGDVPGITSGSRLFFVTFDYNPGGNHEWDESCCSVATGLGLRHLDPGVQQAFKDGMIGR